MIKAQILIFDGFDELDAIAPFEVLQTAAAVGADIQAELVTLAEVPAVATAHGMRVLPHGQLDPHRPPDLLIVPGGGWSNRSQQGAWAEAQRGQIPAIIAQMHQTGVLIASVCTGAMLVAAAGLLNQRHAVTHHAAIDDLAASGAQVVKARVVDEGDIVTAGGVTSGLDLAIWLLERYFGSTVVQEVEQELEYQRREPLWQAV